MSKGPRAMATCYERPGPPPERSRLAPGAAARRRSGSGRSLGGPAMGMSKHAGAADLSGGVVSLAGGGRRGSPRRDRQARAFFEAGRRVRRMHAVARGALDVEFVERAAKVHSEPRDQEGVP